MGHRFEPLVVLEAYPQKLLGASDRVRLGKWPALNVPSALDEKVADTWLHFVRRARPESLPGAWRPHEYGPEERHALGEGVFFLRGDAIQNLAVAEHGHVGDATPAQRFDERLS